MNWIILAVLAGLGSNAFSFFTRYLLKDNDDPTAFAWFYETMQFSIYIVIAVFNWHLIVTAKSLTILLFLGLTECIAVYFYMKMHVYSHLSISTILSRTRLIWIPVMAFFLIGEHLQFREYTGIIILFLGISITVAPHKLFIDKGAMYANVSAFIIALNTVIEKMAIPYASSSVINAALVFPSFLLFPFFMKNAKKRMTKVFQNQFPLKFATVIIRVLTAYVFVFALQRGNVSVVNGIYQGMLMVSVLTGIIFLHEREDIGKKIIGTIVTLAGVLLLS